MHNSFSTKSKYYSPNKFISKIQFKQNSQEKPKHLKMSKLQLSNKINKFELEALQYISSQINSKSKSKEKPFQRFITEQGSDSECYYQNFNNSNHQQRNRSMSNAFSFHKSSDRKTCIMDSKNKKNHNKSWELSEEEWNTFGDRFPKNYQKIKLLGRGGFALVWLGEHKITKARIAIKQIKQSDTHETHIREIEFYEHFFGNSKPLNQFKNVLGIKNLVLFMGYEQSDNFTWIYTEVCGESLASQLYELKAVEYQNEIVYKLIQKPLYIYFRKDLTQLKKIIKEIAYAMILITNERIVHSDIKTENILIKKNKCLNGSYLISQTKLIDYGSSFPFDDLGQFSMATPEYMSPEILNFIRWENKEEYNHKLLKYLQNYYKPWVIDIWSFGCVILEIIHGIPLWMSHQTLVNKYDKDILDIGLFAVKHRSFDKIIEKQIQVVKNLDYYLDNNYSGIKIDLEIRLLLKEMLHIDPNQRIAPQTIIEFLQPTREHLKTQ